MQCYLRRRHQAFIPINAALLRHGDNSTFDRSVPVVLVRISTISKIQDLLA